MFKELFSEKGNLKITMRMESKDGIVSVSIMPDTGVDKSIVPLVLSGTPEELDEHFINAVKTPLDETREMLRNASDYRIKLQDLEMEEKKKLEEKKKVKKSKNTEPVEEVKEDSPNLFNA